MIVRVMRFAFALVLTFTAAVYCNPTAGMGSSATTVATSPTPTTTTPSDTAPATTSSSDTTSTSDSTESADSQTASSDSSDNRGVAIVIFFLGAAALGLAYLFYDRWRASYEKLAEAALKTTGQFPTTVFNPVEDAQFRSRGITAETAEQQPVVAGPAVIVVGEPTVYKATVQDAPATSCTWTLQPPDAATIEPATGAEITLTASKEGPITLNAAVEGGEPTLVHLTAIAKSGESNSGGVPLLGTGFAGVAAAITAFAIAGGLTALNILSGAAFIAFLGPVVGYFFAQARDSAQAGTSGNQGS